MKFESYVHILIVRGEETAIGVDRYTCDIVGIGCGWFREVSARHKDEKIAHPVWGEMTVAAAALLDVNAHSCDAYALSTLKAKRAVRWYKGKFVSPLFREIGVA